MFRFRRLFLLMLVLQFSLNAQRDLGVRPTPSGGALSPEQAAYGVLTYDLAIEIDPGRRFIEATAILEAELKGPLAELVLDLDHPLEVKGVWLWRETWVPVTFRRTEAQIWASLPSIGPVGAVRKLRIDYAGHPREAQKPPWVGGFVWEKTGSGQPWIAVACQVDGADLWWPVKDHPSGEPQRMDLRVTVPEPLVVVSNGTLQDVSRPRKGFQTFHWRVSNPINPYNVTVNIAPYRTIEDTYRSISGESVPVTFWVLPEDLDEGRRLFPQFSRQLRFLEEKLGPYPFRNEKYGVAQVPYLGMEHQTIIGYGNRFQDNEHGFDWLHFHELAHEWWGNLVSAADWNDYWLHEGFASYMEALYAEHLKGGDALRSYLSGFRTRLRNRDALAPRESRTSVEKYFVPPDFTVTDGDVNFKGAWILHSLRFLIGDDAFFESLRRFAYPTPDLETVTDGSQCRFATTEDFQRTVERITGRDLSWFFEVYLRQPKLPELRAHQEAGMLHLDWATPGDLPFPMPVEVQIGEERRRAEVPAGGARLPVGGAQQVSIDPDGWLLREQE